MEDLISSVEAAKILGISRETLLRWASEPRITSIKMPGQTGARVFSRADVLRLAEELKAAS